MNEITSLNLYLITRLDSIHVGCILLLMFLTFLLCILVFMCIDTLDDKKSNKFCHYAIGVAVLIILDLFVKVLLPTTNEMMMIKTVPMVVNNKKIRKCVENLYNISIKTLEDKVLENKNKESK